jgi:PAS domain S-box-containing protein
VTPRIALLAGIGAVVYGVAVVIAARSDTGWTSGVVTAFAVGFSFTTTGIVAIARRPANHTGIWMLAAGFLWALGVLTLTRSSGLFTVGSIGQQLAIAPLAQVLLVYPTGVLERRYHRRLIAAMWAFVISGPVLLALVDRTPTDCDTCPQSAIVVHSSPAASAAVAVVYSIAVAVVAVAIVVELARRYRAAGPPLRRTLGPVYAMFAAGLGLLILSSVLDATSSPAAGPLGGIAVVFIALVPVAFLLGLLRSRLARGSVLQLLVALEGGAPLREALGDALGDPSLQIAYWLAGAGRWADAQGRHVDEPTRAGQRSVTTVERHGEVIAALTHDASLAEEPELVRGVAAAAALSLQAQRAQAELRNQVELLTTFVDTVPSLLVTVDLDGRILNQNGAVLETAGCEDGQIHGRFFWDVFIDAEERQAMKERFAAAAPDHPAAEYENAFTNLRGERRVVFWRSAPVHDEEGRVVSIVAGGLDVTERRRREEAARETEERFRAVVENAPVAIVEIGPDERVNLWNPAAERIFGWPAEEILGRPPRWVPDDHRDEFRALSEREALGESYTGYETIRIDRDGHRLDVEIAAAPIRDANGEFVGAMAVLSDITDRRRQQEELRASRVRIVQAADEARRRLERDLHDGAQQRLVALSVSLRLAEAKLAADPETAGRVLAGAREELALALEELRELARGIHPAVLTDRGLAAAVEGLVTRTPLPVAVDVTGARLPPSIEAALYYVTAESLTNVVKYAGAGGAAIRLRATDDSVVLEIADDGVGDADPARGSGLRGLADRVEALGGRLTIASPTGGGTRVRVEIPLEDADHPV